MIAASTLLLALLAGGSEDHAAVPAPDRKAAVEDPFAKNACVTCHRNLAGRLAEIVDLEWGQSVHYAGKVGCDGCHGGDPSLDREQFPSDEAFKEAAHLARSPEFLEITRPEGEFIGRARGRSISYFCGRCHAEIMEKHLGSPHGDFGIPSCLYCHGQGSHKIEKASIDIIDTRPRSEAGRWSPCHRASTMRVVATVKEILGRTATLIDTSARKFLELEESGYRNLALGEMHHHTPETHSRLRRVFHSFNMRDINSLARSIEAVSKQTDYAYDLVQSVRRASRRQTLVGLAAVGFLLLFAGLLLYFKEHYCEDYDRSRALPESLREGAPAEVKGDREKTRSGAR